MTVPVGSDCSFKRYMFKVCFADFAFWVLLVLVFGYGFFVDHEFKGLFGYRFNNYSFYYEFFVKYFY